MQMVGTQNAHNLITSSTDGTVCSWLVDMLAQPQVPVFWICFIRPMSKICYLGNARADPRGAQQDRGGGSYYARLS